MMHERIERQKAIRDTFKGIFMDGEGKKEIEDRGQGRKKEIIEFRWGWRDRGYWKVRDKGHYDWSSNGTREEDKCGKDSQKVE